MPVNVRSNIAVINEINGMAPIPGLSGDGDESSLNIYETDEYLARRRGLIAHEKQKRFDAEKRTRRTEAEIKADEYVKQLRKEEIENVYNNPNDLGMIKGSSWALSKSRGVQDGALYKLISEMPKGAVLHCHMDGTIDVDWLIRNTYEQDNLFILSNIPLTEHRLLYTANVIIRHLPQEAGTEEDCGFARSTSEDADDIFSSSYKPNTWIPLSKARKSFPFPNVYNTPIPGYESNLKDYSSSSNKTPSAIAFDAYLYSKMAFAPVSSDLVPPITNSRQAWQYFISTFNFLNSLQTKTTRTEMYKRSFRHSVNDNIAYVEARINFFDQTLLDAKGKSTVTHEEMLIEFEDALKAVQAELPQGKTFDAKVIYSTLRFIDPEQLQWYIDDAIKLKQQFPNLLVGFDLVGHEDPGKTLYDYLPQLLAMKKRLAQLQIDLPFCFHAGETLGDGDAVDDNLYDALLLGSKRIGHAFSLSRHPTLVEAVRQKGVCIESCPISNQVLRYNDTQGVHPVLTLLAYGCPVALSHDDPSQFLNLGLSPDFYSILIASDHFDLTSLGVLARNSLQHSLQPDLQRKQALIDEWDHQWTLYINKIASNV
jgi:adenosine deaminase CECR1